MRFLIDANLPRLLAAWLARRGHGCEHVLDLGLARASDDELWSRCGDGETTIVTKDVDFADRVRAGRPGPAVVWLRTGNGTTYRLIETLAAVIDAV